LLAAVKKIHRFKKMWYNNRKRLLYHIFQGRLRHNTL